MKLVFSYKLWARGNEGKKVITDMKEGPADARQFLKRSQEFVAIASPCHKCAATTADQAGNAAKRRRC